MHTGGCVAHAGTLSAGAHLLAVMDPGPEVHSWPLQSAFMAFAVW